MVYADYPFVISIFTKNSDYDTISKIAKDVYEVLKWGNRIFLIIFSREDILKKHTKVVLALSGGLDSMFLFKVLSTYQKELEMIDSSSY